MSQPVLETIREHMAADLDRELLGLLGGELLVCPETLRRWIKVEEALDPVPPAPVGVNGENTEQALLPLVAEARGKAWSPIGWYHVCGRKGFTISETEADIHARYFSLPWHLFLLVLADLGRPAGGLFVRSESGRFSRSQYRPFYELLGDDAQLSNGRIRTFVGWQNYMTDAPVVRAFSEADDVSGWNVWRPDRQPASGRRSWRGRRVAVIAGVVAALMATGWAVWDRLPSQPFDSLRSVIEFASPADLEPAGVEAAELPSGDTSAPTGGVTRESGEATLARFWALASGYEQAASEFRRGELGCSQLATAYQAVNGVFEKLSKEGGEGDQFLDIARRLNRSIENDTDPGGRPDSSDPETRMRRIREQYLASGCERP